MQFVRETTNDPTAPAKRKVVKNLSVGVFHHNGIPSSA